MEAPSQSPAYLSAIDAVNEKIEKLKNKTVQVSGFYYFQREKKAAED